MLKAACRQTWKYRQSLRQRRIHICYRAYQSASAPAQALSLRWDTKISKNHDDRTLREIFDSHHVWSAFSSNDTSRARKGLFQNIYLKDPAGFERFAEATLARCKRIVGKVLDASSQQDYEDLPDAFDRLSDSLCRVLDLSDFVRATHPDKRFQVAADGAYQILYEYMNVLNTTPRLNEQLKRALAQPEVTGKWTEEQRNVAQRLLEDFSKSAIHLPQAKRERFVDLSSAISNLGNRFLAGMAPAQSTLIFDGARLKGMDPTHVKEITDRRGRAHIPVIGPYATLALRHVQDAAIRREIYTAGRTCTGEQVSILEQLLHMRAEIAGLAGFRSYAELNLSDKMAKTPDAVNSFLAALSADNALHIKQETDEMLSLASKEVSSERAILSIDAWDKEYYSRRLASQIMSKSRRPDFISAYFSLGTVMQGLSRLFSRLYGVRFVPHETSPGETWSPDVRRLDIIDELEGHIAVVYCDLFARAGKNPNPAHFTVRCSRHITPIDLAEASEDIPGLDPILAANDGMATAVSPTTGILHQLPTIVLICDFAAPGDLRTPTLLSFRDVQTLFHEMGHAIHSILGRTALQVVSGTRCATDFAELPSVLMEHFAADPSVLALFARHWETGATLPYDMVAERLTIDRKGQGADAEHQILLAMLDQAYHSPIAASSSFDSTEAFHDIHARYSSVAEPRGTTAQGFFGHLVEYGGLYYSYLFDRAIAGKVWKKVFAGGKGEGAVMRENGERFRQEVLQWGGGRDGWKCVAAVLGDETLSEGGPQAMRKVGEWGVKD
ncbi:MAG: hypothetical protein Q9191_001127 [Dirinaria sp. TL-2023a]